MSPRYIAKERNHDARDASDVLTLPFDKQTCNKAATIAKQSLVHSRICGIRLEPKPRDFDIQ
ncbi:hypothetical protein AXW67_12025 [Bradyrhizobium neotropicale]|uniref:Uncharacterized protein n=1 Tax=Bradyrhizobium neotropicale TaxID=1497615 RepID=A0A176Z8M0_9BRAD|nr:hypothetical protein AXW67_12025 [Bradyrhizobium neotropicale]